MRYDEVALGDAKIVVGEDIEIDRAGTPAERRYPAEVGFDRFERAEERAHAELGVEQHGRVEEIGLIGHAPGARPIERHP